MDDRSLNGLYFGLFAGLVFSLSVWGADGLLLARSSAAYPWVKLLLGGGIALLACGLAGWISARVDHALVSFLIWTFTGLFLAWLASHMPFEGISTALGLLKPNLKSFDAYPFVYSAEVRMKILYFVVGGLCGLGGVVSTYLVESAVQASTTSTRWITFALCIPLFIIPGIAIDDLVNQNLRAPILGVDEMIRNALAAEQKPVSKEEARAMHLRALDPVTDQLHKPRKLYLGDIDETSLDQASVVIDFDGTFAQCWTVGTSPTFCQRSDDRYLDKLACLLRKDPNRNCGIKVPPEAESSYQTVSSQAGPSTSAQVTNQVGTLIDIRVNNQAASYDCRLRLHNNTLSLESCEPATQEQASALPAGNPVRIFEKKTATTAPTQVAGGSVPTVTPAMPVPTVVATVAAATAAATTPGSQPTPATVKEETFDQPPVFLPYSMAELADLSSATLYTLTLNVDYENLSFQGHAEVSYTNAEQVQLSSLFFRLFPNGGRSYGNGSLTVDRSLVESQPVTTRLSVENTALEVPLPQALNPGESLLVAFDFTGTIPTDFGGDITPDGYGIYNFSDGVLALADWYPILAVYDDEGWNLDPSSAIGDSVYADMAFYSVDLATNSDLVVAATGTAQSRKTAGDTTTYRFSSGPVREFFVILSPSFSTASQTVGETRVNSYSLPGEESGGQQALDIASAALEIYNQRFGVYPYTELDVVQAPMRNASGVEFPGIVLIGASLYEKTNEPSFSITVAHEVAHQWWYNLVGNDVIDEPWLDEALTSYSSEIYLEEARGPAAGQGLVDYWQDRYDKLVQDGKDDQVTRSLPYFESLNDPRVYGTVAYVKGALFYNALRKEIGDQAFFDGLRLYYDTYRYRIATTAGLLDVFEKASGRQLDDIAQKWLYSPD